MTWIEVERRSEPTAGVALRVSRQRLRNSEYLYLVRIRISGEVLHQAGLAAGDAVDLLRGVSEDAGRLRVQVAAGLYRSFQIVGTGSGERLAGSIAVPAALLGIEEPAAGPSVPVLYRVEPGVIEIDLPEPLHADEDEEAGETLLHREPLRARVF